VVAPTQSWSKACPNTPLAIVSQAGVPGLTEGVPGVGKSSVVFQWSRFLGRDLMYLIGSTHAPEDFSGIPFVSECKKFFMQTPPMWAARLARPGAILFIDELTTVPPSVRAALLSMLTERRLGDLQIHPDTMILSACNPSHMAPNASPLERSMANRFFHWGWEHDKKAWGDGMLSEDDNFQPRWIPVLPPDWRRFKSQVGASIVAYTNKNSGELVSVPKSDEEMAFPTPRTWKYLRDCLAAATAVNAPKPIMSKIAYGLVGKQTGSNYIRFVGQQDLVDPETAIKEPDVFKHDKKRADLTVTLLTSVVTCIKREYSQERMDSAIELFCKNIGQDTADLVFTQLRHLVEARPEGTALSKAAIASITEFGKRIPDHLKVKKKAG